MHFLKMDNLLPAKSKIYKINVKVVGFNIILALFNVDTHKLKWVYSP